MLEIRGYPYHRDLSIGECPKHGYTHNTRDLSIGECPKHSYTHNTRDLSILDRGMPKTRRKPISLGIKVGGDSQDTGIPRSLEN